MDFENQYLTHEEYSSLGGSMEENTFKVKEYRAEKLIDENTNCRLREFETIPQEVKLCIFDLIEDVLPLDSILQSETIGDYSKTYASKNDVKNMKQSIIREYLSGLKTSKGTPLLYRGTDED